MGYLRGVAEREGFAAIADWTRADAVIKSRDGIAIDITKAQ
jgi:hypothetical protein